MLFAYLCSFRLKRLHGYRRLSGLIVIPCWRIAMAERSHAAIVKSPTYRKLREAENLRLHLRSQRAHATLLRVRPLCEFCFHLEAQVLFPLRDGLQFCRPCCAPCKDLARDFGYRGVGIQRIAILGTMWASTKSRDTTATLPEAFHDDALRVLIYSFLWSARIYDNRSESARLP